MSQTTTSKELKVKKIDNYDDFRQAISSAQFKRQGFVEVTKQMFDALTEGTETPYLTYGDPGIKVYIEGTKEKIDEIEALSADKFYERKIQEAKK